MQKQLAIIIPAYKDKYLRFALESIANQTCKDFTLYIGDDCSPYPIREIVGEYKDRINLIYKRFEKNLGSVDLVGQWERCIEMSRNEPYIWLFSDDDMLEPQCVESFYRTIAITNGKYDVYHFDVNIINEKNKVFKIPKEYPKLINNYKYYKGKMLGKYSSLVVENIFTREAYNRVGRFQNFDLAWGSDTATWIKLMNKTGMYRIDCAKVLWRYSELNISPDITIPIINRKIASMVAFFEWTYCYFNERKNFIVIFNIIGFIKRMRMYSSIISKDELSKYVIKFCKVNNILFAYRIILIFIIIKK